MFFIKQLNQIKETVLGTIFAVVGSNLTVAYIKVKMFALYHKFILEIL